MLISIDNISMPTTVKTGETFIISVTVETSAHERLLNWLHSQLTRFTHKQLSDDRIGNAPVPNTHGMLAKMAHKFLTKFSNRSVRDDDK